MPLDISISLPVMHLRYGSGIGYNYGNACKSRWGGMSSSPRLELESNPVRYEGQALENTYHWWIYPNYDDGVYSKVLTRVNIFGDLVIGTGEETCLVCIRHGRLTIARQIADDVVSASDERLLVCL